MRRLIIIIAALLGALGTTAAALAASDAPITESILGSASIAHPYTIKVGTSRDVVVAKAIVRPGASFGWHSHRSAVVVVVQSGTLTLYDGGGHTCTPRRYTAGQGFVEQANHVHLARNEGPTKTVLLVSYLGLRHGVNPDVPAANPGNCSF
jgi:quercetin dioxygenase-like cupin family protein